MKEVNKGIASHGAGGLRNGIPVLTAPTSGKRSHQMERALNLLLVPYLSEEGIYIPKGFI
jgi:hypothetical protein